jgi:hypothetical protein
MADGVRLSIATGDGSSAQRVSRLWAGVCEHPGIHKAARPSPERITGGHQPAQADVGVAAGVSLHRGNQTTMSGEAGDQQIVHHRSLGSKDTTHRPVGRSLWMAGLWYLPMLVAVRPA